jgi:hypothetical protein
MKNVQNDLRELKMNRWRQPILKRINGTSVVNEALVLKNP